MKVGPYTIENTAESTWDKHFVCHIIITSINMSNYNLVTYHYSKLVCCTLENFQGITFCVF